MTEESHEEYIKRTYEEEPKLLVLKVIKENPNKTQNVLLKIAMKECRGSYNPLKIRALIRKFS